ncbi:MAG: metal-binding protein [Eubacteriaceae bacterium]|nr:metal-binding protein [Eubacteriaceae bacterium]MBR5995260.1 metal-binding protein [Eubacteriaceae bacterium]
MSYKFTQNKSCYCFPCHEGIDEEHFSCLFCYCPLYALGDKCGGNFRFTSKGVKDCTPCKIPHLEKNYEYMLSKLRILIDQVTKKHLEETGQAVEAEQPKQ